MNNSASLRLIIWMEWTSIFKNSLPKVSKERTDDLKCPITIKEIQSINKYVKQKAPCPHKLIGEVSQTFEKEIFPILYGLYKSNVSIF